MDSPGLLSLKQADIILAVTDGIRHLREHFRFVLWCNVLYPAEIYPITTTRENDALAQFLAQPPANPPVLMPETATFSPL